MAPCWACRPGRKSSCFARLPSWGWQLTHATGGVDIQAVCSNNRKRDIRTRPPPPPKPSQPQTFFLHLALHRTSICCQPHSADASFSRRKKKRRPCVVESRFLPNLSRGNKVRRSNRRRPNFNLTNQEIQFKPNQPQQSSIQTPISA